MTRMGPEQIDRLRGGAAQVFAGTPVFLAYVYGSRVYGSPRSRSDVDVGYYTTALAGDTPLPIADELALEDALSASVGLEVDLRDLGRAPLELRGRVLEEGIRIYCRDRVRQVNLERDLLTRYHDYKPTFQRMRALRLSHVAAKGLR